MEFLKTCRTNVQAVAGFEAVAFQAFSVKRTPLASSLPLNSDRQPSEDSRAAEAALREDGQLVSYDTGHAWLWLFEATTVDKVGESPQNVPSLDGYEFQREQASVMKASELARPAINRSSSSNTPSSASASSPSTPALLRANPMAGAHQQQAHDSFAVYEVFMSAVISAISHYSVKHLNAIALNYRTFLTKPIPVDGEEADGVPFCLTSVSVQWASCGTLLVSTYSVADPTIHCLDEAVTVDSQKQMLGRCIRVAPNGCLARLVSFEDALITASEETNPRPHRKRAKVGPLEQGIERWKGMVARWLSYKGYSVCCVGQKTTWVRIRMAQPGCHIASPSCDILWPQALCYFYDNDEKRGLGIEPHGQKENGLEWFATIRSDGFQDPLDLAQQWFLRKSERDKNLEALRRAQRQEEEASRPKEDNSGPLFASSPLNSRTGAYGDLQASSGVYPTPPDGVLPGMAVTHSDTPSISSLAANVVAPGAANPAINVLAPQESLSDDQQQMTSPDFSLQFDNFNSSGGNDHLFEDTDEDGFGGIGVTDADFNFFDEPDGDDVDMQDAPDNKPTSSKDEERGLPFNIKEEMSDPMAALEYALEAASRPIAEHDADMKMEDASNVDAHEELDMSRLKHSHSASLVTVNTEPTPPLSPRNIQERLLPFPENNMSMKGQYAQQRESLFDPINFNQNLSLTDAKYYHGRFTFPHEEPVTLKAVAKAQRERPASLRHLPLVNRLRYVVGLAKEDLRKDRPLAVYGDTSDTSSETSLAEEDQAGDSDSPTPGPLSAGIIGPGKRKFPTDGNATPVSATSYADSFVGDGLDFAGVSTDEGSLSLFEPNPCDWPLTNVPPPTELHSATGRYSVPAFSPILTSMPSTPTSQSDCSFDPPEDKPLSRNDSIAVAQVVTDQIISATLDILNEDGASIQRPAGKSAEARFQLAIKTIFPNAVDCNLMTLISVPDVFPELPPGAKGQRAPARRANDSALPGFHVLPMHPPQIRVRRSENLWDFLPPALAFWESLGLSPCSAPKNVAAFCIYPRSDALRPCVEHFLANLRIAYEGCKLGNHDRLETVSEFEGGLVPWEVGSPGVMRAAFKSLRETCVMLGKVLAAKHGQTRDTGDAAKTDAFVIYMVNPFEDASAVWELCSAFWILFQAYGHGPSGRTELPKPDLVLQIVPVGYVASFEVPVTLSGSTYATLAREIYDRSPPSAPSPDKTPLSIYAAPSFQLEETIPRTIQFRLLAEPPPDLLRENSYIHIGYAISLDGNWVTTAWTDSCGKSRTAVSYNLGTRAFAEIAKEIWQTTIEICQARRVTWRLCIAKSGAIEREELEAWHFLSTCSAPLSLFTTLLSVDTNPQIKFTPTMAITGPQTATTQPQTNTPGSTPTAQAGVSPDPHNLTPAATPAPENSTDPSNEPDARLVDVTDESWAVILSHRLHNANSSVEFRPSLISGLLVKRGQPHYAMNPLPSTPDPSAGPLIIAVNILWINAVSPNRSSQPPSPSFTSQSNPLDTIPPSLANMAQQSLTSTPLPASPATERTGGDRMSLMWTPTPQTRTTAENLLKEILTQYRGLGTLARLKGVRGSKMGAVPWHIAVAERGVTGLGRCLVGC